MFEVNVRASISSSLRSLLTIKSEETTTPVVAGSDDFQLRVYNYNTHEKVTALEARRDYIRCLTVHPTASIFLTGSGDMTIRAWDWEKGWKKSKHPGALPQCSGGGVADDDAERQIYEGHTHPIMNLTFNPKDPNTFASACLVRTVKMWSIGAPPANFTMDVHENGSNYVDFYPGADKPYLVTVGDDKTLKVWDHLSKTCVQTMEGHTNNVSFAVFHPSLPLIISGSEEGTLKLWNSGTYRLENTLSHALERAWCIGVRKDANEIAVGFDEGAVVIKLGRDEPTSSIDPSGKLVFTRNQQVMSGNLQMISQDISTSSSDGARLPLSLKDIGSTETFATGLIHSPNGRFVTVVGDGEYITYTALARRNKAFGSAPSSRTRSSSSSSKTSANEVALGASLSMEFTVGRCSVRVGLDLLCSGTGTQIVRRIDVEAQNVFWLGSGTLVAITAVDSYYILRFDRDAYNAKIEEGADISDEGVEEAFDVVAEVPDGFAPLPLRFALSNNLAVSRRPSGSKTVSSTLRPRRVFATSSGLNPTPSVPSIPTSIFSAISPPTIVSTSQMSTFMATQYL